MRRNERAVTDISEIIDFIDNEDVMRLGFTDAEGMYIVPVNFGYVFEDGRFIFYFHGASAGRKASIIRNGPVRAGFELDGRHEAVITENCSSTYNYMSVMGSGTAEELTDRSDKIAALDSIMQHVGRKEGPFEYGDRVLDATLTFRLVVDEYTAKQNRTRL